MMLLKNSLSTLTSQVSASPPAAETKDDNIMMVEYDCPTRGITGAWSARRSSTTAILSWYQPPGCVSLG